MIRTAWYMLVVFPFVVSIYLICWAWDRNEHEPYPERWVD